MHAFLISASMALGLQAAAAPAENYVAIAEQRELHADAMWLRLGYYEDVDDDSEVTTPDFFLADNGRDSARAELAATIRGWFSKESGDQHPACRFPARYAWLQREIGLPALQDPPRCENYRKWARLDEIDSASVLMVSGYLGNPASSFGHTLVKFNYGEDSAANRLLDMSFSFGALVPENEFIPLYIFRGLTGGYQAGFSDKLYYAYDRVYTHTEFRDIWEYELELDRGELEMLVAHMWEVSGMKFTYYFLTKNCSYRMAQVLSVATDSDVTPSATVWFTPEELFFLLQQRERKNEREYLGEADFRPSEQRLLYSRFSVLDERELELANRMIREPGTRLEQLIEPLDAERQVVLLDALLAYYQYRLAAVEDEQASGYDPNADAAAVEELDPDIRALKDLKQQLLLARLQRPVSRTQFPEPERIPPVTEQHAPALTELGAARVGDFDGGYLRVAAYYRDLLSDPLISKELVVMDTEASSYEGGATRIDSVDVIRVRRFQSDSIPIAGEDSGSWTMKFGARRFDPVDNELDPFIEGGIGRATRLGESVMMYGLLDGTLTDAQEGSQVGAVAGLAAYWPGFRAELRSSPGVSVKTGEWQPHWELELQWPVTRDFQLQLRGEHRDSEDFLRLGLQWYW